MKNIISLLLTVALSTPDAFAKAPRPAASARTPTPPTRTVASEQPDHIAEMKKACTAADSFATPAPKPSDSPTAVSVDDLTVDDSKWTDLKFHTHCKVETSNIADCDGALAAVLKYVREGKLSLKKLREEVCQEKISEAEKCKTQTDQAGALRCVHGIYNSLAGDFKKTSEQMTERSKRLKDLNAALQRKAKQSLKKTPPEITESRAHAVAIRKVNGEGLSGVNPLRGPAQTQACARDITTTAPLAPVPVRKICSQITAASDTAFYAAQLAKAARETELASGDFQKKADLVNQAVGRSGSPDSPGGDTDKNKKGGMLDGVGGLDGLIKMATLGVMGAGLYCSVSGQCSQQSSAQNPAANNSGIAATSPTPASTNSETQTSSTGDPNKVATNGTGTTHSETPKVETPSSGPEGYSSTGSGFGSDKDKDHELAPFSGALDRAPASSGSPGGGGSSAGSSEGGGTPRETVADASKNTSPDNGGLGPIGGGGGLGHSGGFSLGDPASATPADSALKNILNGDAPPGDAGLASILDGGSSGVPTQASDVDLQGAESLFFRVRDTHVRCIKRGCVGHEVREKI